jgi:uncharacterized repeat protein (TIGR01451 family)
MYRRIFISTLLLLALFVQVLPVQAQPVSKPVEATYTDWAQFISDVTVPDGTNFAANTPFTKIWRLKNIGNSTWTSAFSVVFISGEMMSSVSPQFLTTNVIPGQSVDISVNMVAPANPGTYQGFWALKNASGVLFGIGPSANSPFWVKITVGTGVPTGGVVYDFVTNAGSANWLSQTSSLPYPGNPIDTNGSVTLLSNPQLENGTTVSTPGLETRPNNTSSGFIKGVYPEFYVQSTDRFKATISCPYNAPGCNLYFQLDYQIGSGAVSTYWSFREKADGLYYNADIDLSLLAGKNVKFILTVFNDGAYSDNDKGLWVAPRLERGSTPPVTPPPPSGCTDKVAFIADVTVPDYTNFAPNTAFTKTWRLKNIGTCTWTTSYATTYISGDPMSAVYPVAMPYSVAPGQSVDVSVNMVSPSVSGTYKGNWGLKNAAGTIFSLGTYANIPFWVLINVGGGGTSPTPVPGACTNKAAFVSDVTVPDNSYLAANTAFTKIWRLKNTGTCTWTTAYSTTFVSGDPMSAVYPVALPYTVVPGQSVDVAVNMVAPSYAGTYKGNWSLKSNTGQIFALGAAANVPFYVLIQVLSSGPTPTPGSPTATPLVTPTGITSDLSVTISNNKTTYTPGSPTGENYTITLTNNGPYAVVDAFFSYKPSPAQTANYSVSCVPDTGAACTPNPGLSSGSTFNDSPDLPAFTKIVYTAGINTPSNATGALNNIVSVSVPAGITDPNPSNNNAQDTDVAAPVADLTVASTADVTSYTPGILVTYTIIVTNNGPSDVTGALFGDSVTSQVGTWKVTCVPVAPATCTASSPDLSVGAGQTYYADSVYIPNGYSVTYTVKAQLTLSGTGSLTNTASVAAPSGTTDPTPSNNTFVLTLNAP